MATSMSKRKADIALRKKITEKIRSGQKSNVFARLILFEIHTRETEVPPRKVFTKIYSTFVPINILNKAHCKNVVLFRTRLPRGKKRGVQVPFFIYRTR